MSEDIPVRIRVGDRGREYEIGTIERPADGTPGITSLRLAGFLREVAADIERQHVVMLPLPSPRRSPDQDGAA